MTETTDELFKLIAFKSDSTSAFMQKKNTYKENKEELEREFLDIEENGRLDALYKIRKQVKLGSDMVTDVIHFETTLKNSILIYACSIFDFYLSKLTEFLYQHNPRTLATSKKSIAYDKILTEPFNMMISNIIEREVHEISYKRIDERVKYLSDKFELDIEFVDAQPSRFLAGEINGTLLTTAFAYRNLILHNRGKVNNIFLNTVKNSKYTLGDIIKIEDDLLFLLIMMLVRSSTNIYKQVEVRYWE